MLILGIAGSPRKGGNSDLLLEEALKGARSAGARTEKIHLCGLDIDPCFECGGCSNTGRCVRDDNMRLVYRKFGEADAVIVASPVFFASVSAQLKAMIDRFHCLWVRKYILNPAVAGNKPRKGLFLCVAGSKKPWFFENAAQIVRALFATLDIEYAGDIFAGEVDEKGAIKNEDAAMRKAFAMGAALAKGM